MTAWHMVIVRLLRYNSQVHESEIERRTHSGAAKESIGGYVIARHHSRHDLEDVHSDHQLAPYR